MPLLPKIIGFRFPYTTMPGWYNNSRVDHVFYFFLTRAPLLSPFQGMWVNSDFHFTAT